MPNENSQPGNPKFDSGRPIVVAHPEDGSHSIQLPEGMDLSIPEHAQEFHEALVKSGYQHPTAQGALENSPAFKTNAQKLWNLVTNGKDRAEAGNFVNNDGTYTAPIKRPDEASGAGKINFGAKPANAEGVIHTHPRTGGPSPQDIQTAKDNKMTVYVVDADGLHAIDPGGNVTRVYQSTGQLFDQGPKPKPKWVPKYRTDPKTGQQLRIN